MRRVRALATPRGPARSRARGRLAPTRTTTPTKSVSRAERRRAARVRRNRIVLALAVAVSGGIVAAWFPTSSLLHQRTQLAAASIQLGQLQRENAALRHQEEQLRTPTTLGRIAQEQYDLVPPGDQAYQVLPASGSGGLDGTLGPASVPGAPRTSGGVGGATTQHLRGSSGSREPAGTSGGGGLIGRMLRTLEFWR